jgi:hypothetical protein
MVVCILVAVLGSKVQRAAATAEKQQAAISSSHSWRAQG